MRARAIRRAKEVGKLIADRAKGAGIDRVVFDRGGDTTVAWRRSPKVLEREDSRSDVATL